MSSVDATSARDGGRDAGPSPTMPVPSIRRARAPRPGERQQAMPRRQYRRSASERACVSALGRSNALATFDGGDGEITLGVTTTPRVVASPSATVA
jgi:hypothetical protein